MTFIQVPPDTDLTPFQGLVPLDMGAIASVPVPRISGGGAASAAGTSGGVSYPALGTNGIHAVEHSIPGTGFVTDETRCGTWLSTHACSQDPAHYLKKIKDHCDNPRCPICYTSWMNKAAKRISERVRGYIEAANGTQVDLDGLDLALWHKDNTRYLNHYVGSPRPGEITPDMPYNEIKQRGRAMAGRIGITGAVQVFHPFRIKKALQTRLSYACRAASHMNEDDREKKFWQLVREDVLYLGDWREYVEWSPHFHYIGFGRLPEQRTPEQKAEWAKVLAGWVFRWIRHVDAERTFNGQDIEDPIAELAVYLLSHAGYLSGKKIPSWLGVMGPNYLRKLGDPEHLSHAVVCPVCGSPVILYDPSMGDLVPRQDPNTGAPVHCRMRYCDQKYEIKHKMKKPG